MKAILEGAYDAIEGLMDDFYRTDGILDTEDPYGLNTTVDAAVLTPIDGDAVVDWVKIQLRDKDDPSNILAEKAALIQRDGDIIDETGKLQISFENMAAESYFVSLKHYNHLGVMTANPISLSSLAFIDFTSPLTPVYDLGGPASKNDNGTMTLWAGDAN